MKAGMILMGGMGYPLTETPMGLPSLKARLETLKVTVLLISWDQRQEAYNFASGVWDWLGGAGDSLGAGSAGQYPGDVKKPFNYAVGFQPSMDDDRTRVVKPGLGEQIIASNIIRAHCIYDPIWADTIGLGQAQWVTPPDVKTKLLVTQHRGAHPDDWGYSQDMIFNEIKGLLSAPGK